MPKRYKKIQPKLKPLPFIIIGIIIVAIVLLVVFLRDTPQQTFHKKYVANGAYDLDKDHVYKEISYKTLNKKIKDEEEMLVYFGKYDCQECVREVSLYNEEFKSEDLNLGEYFDYIYFINVAKLSKKEVEEIVKKYNYTEESPLFTYIKDGKVEFDRFDYEFSGGEGNPGIRGEIYKFLRKVKQQQ